METFQVETAARRVLKELIESFINKQDDANTRIKKLDEGLLNNNRQVSDVNNILKKI